MMLFILLLLCHYLGDYTHLSRPFMLAAKRFGKPIGPILLHALVHAVLMASVVFLFSGFRAAMVGLLIQLVSHFVIDVLKGRMNVWYPALQSPANIFHWYVFGFDQTLHIVIIFLIYSTNC